MNKTEFINALDAWSIVDDDVFQTIDGKWCIKRSGIDKIIDAENINVQFEFAVCEREYVVIIGVGSKHINGKIKSIQTTASVALDSIGSTGDRIKGTTTFTHLPEIAEHRLRSRIALRMTGLYSQGILGEDENDLDLKPASNVAKAKGQSAVDKAFPKKKK
jgi:hypothetical protein